jgi:hypothetical protein
MNITTISASRVGAMLGVDPRKSPLALFHELRGDLPEQEDVEILREGREFEDAIGRVCSWKFGVKVIDTGGINLEHGPLSGHPDRFFVQDNTIGVLEIKNALRTNDGTWGDTGTDLVPKHYWLQAQVYAHLYAECFGGREGVDMTTADYVLLAANMLHGGTRLYTIRRDAEVMAMIEKEAEDFLRRLRDNDPPTPRDEEDMRRRWLVDGEKQVVATSEVIAQCRTLAQLNKQIREAEKAASDLKTLILGYAQDAAKLVDESGNVVATMGADRKFDADAFAAENPDLAAQFRTKLDTAALSKQARAVYERYMRKPATAQEQKRTIRIKGDDK